MNRIFWVSGSILAGLAVAAGAYGAHAVETLGAQQAVWIEKAARYQMYHSLALVLVSFAMSHLSETKLLQIAGGFFLAGILLFSGSLYAMAFTGINLGLMTPAGGVSFMVGWGLVAYAGLSINPVHR